MKIALLVLALFSGLASIAQGNLQFNQVKMVTTLETVPTDKVRKVESVVYNIGFDSSPYQAINSASCSSVTWRSTGIEINGIPTKVGSGTMSQHYSNVQNTISATKLPLWLPSGYTLSGGPCNLMVSVIEFNSVP